MQKIKDEYINIILLGMICLLLTTSVFAQGSYSIRLAKVEEKISKLVFLKGFKFLDYFQGEFQYGQANAGLKVGSRNTDLPKGFNRFGIRRGRLKISYERGIGAGVFQIDMTA